jgi:hypothetical protein
MPSIVAEEMSALAIEDVRSNIFDNDQKTQVRDSKLQQNR